MINKNEKSLINAIKFFPIFFVIIISSSITVFLYFEKQTELKKEQEYIKAEFIKQNEEEVKKQVENLYTFITRVQKKTEDKSYSIQVTFSTPTKGQLSKSLATIIISYPNSNIALETANPIPLFPPVINTFFDIIFP